MRPAPPGLLPHGGRRRGHLRAHADHRRRRRRGELHRGLHGPDVQRQLDALGRRRDLRDGGGQGPLHDGPELVQGRLQPQHQARGRPGRGHGRVGRRFDGGQGRHALPGVLPPRRGRPGRPPQRRRSREGRPQGHRRQGRPHGPEHDVEHPRQVDLQGRRDHGLPGPRANGQELPGLEVPRPMRRPDDGRDLPLRHLAGHPDPEPQRHRRPRGHGRADLRRAALLHGLARLHRGRGGGDDRQRLHRAGDQGAPDGVRDRAQPPDPARDGSARRSRPGAAISPASTSTTSSSIRRPPPGASTPGTTCPRT